MKYEKRVCVDCGVESSVLDKDLVQKSPVICRNCIESAVPEPDDGWPIKPMWIGPAKGRGVFSRRDIISGETVERCWVMALPQNESLASGSMPVLNRYTFPWVGSLRVLVTGSGLLYNMDDGNLTKRNPNLECALRIGISAIEFRALRDIRMGEELTWNYSKAKVRRL